MNLPPVLAPISLLLGEKCVQFSGANVIFPTISCYMRYHDEQQITQLATVCSLLDVT